ncbi:glycogen debranching N-terminal domain-containing protein [Sandaracinus amylolyticus]|uniref:glycogen debranching N-terminal domain-containing protein n=1 Tax=Sandaracinus amylolyticus TaxID=927083 RepID=UPI001F482331|nr:glycogen debranching N-terminal domain-containing protein [Sandaracinus amylolyticus]
MRLAWRGPTMLVTDVRGELGRGVTSTGLWFRETRYLRTMRLLVNGRAPHLCALGGQDARTLDLVYVHPELEQFGGGGSGLARSEESLASDGLPHRSIDVRVSHAVQLDGLESRYVVANRSRRVARLVIDVALDCDWADIGDTIGDREAPVRIWARAVCDGSSLELRSTHPQLRYVTHVEAPGASAHQSGVRWTLELAPRDEVVLPLRVRAIDFEDALTGEGIAAREDALARWRASHVVVDTTGHGVEPLVIAAALEDLASLPLLEGRPREWLAPQAGLPIYPALFGRDALTTGWQASCVDGGAMLDAALARLGRLQCTRDDPRIDAQPGRIPQQVRRGPRARLGDGAFAVSYADVASPLMYVISLAQLFALRGDEALIRPHLDTARRILDWAHEQAQGGFLHYHTRSSDGPEHQGWKDSGGAMVHADGSSARSPIAACEIQGYWFAAQELLALVLWMLGRRGDARALWDSARDLKRRFHRAFWMEDESFYGLGIDREGRLLRSVTSNVGHCIASGIVAQPVIERVVERMFAPDLWSGWGFRTLSSAHPAYEPLSYHCGSVWSVESTTIALGLRRFGLDRRALQLADATLALASLYPGFRVPECVGGYAKDEMPHPGAYPRADLIQAWNVSAIPGLLHAMMGFFNVAPLDLLTIDPILPTCLDRVRVKGLRVGRGVIDLDVWRDRDGRSHFDVTRREGTLHVVRQPPPESISVGIAGRVRALVEGLLPS